MSWHLLEKQPLAFVWGVKHEMTLRRVDITRTTNLADPKSVGSNPRVRKAWLMPWGFTLFEFYDPIYEQLDNPSSKLSNVVEWGEETRRYMGELVEAERNILAPVYRGKPRHWQGNKLGLPLRSVIYRIIDRGNLDLPWFGYSPDWEIITKIRICGRVRETIRLKTLEGVVEGWSKWLENIGQKPESDRFSSKGKDFQFQCQFSEPCGDACMALYTALVASYKATSIEAIGFFLAEQTEFRYLEIGGQGEILAKM